MKQALLVTSFGSSHLDATESITAIEQYLAVLTPARELRRAYTSPTIRRSLSARGILVPSVEEALLDLEAAGYTDVIVQPTHLLPGIEYDKITTCVKNCRGRFEKLFLGAPLLARQEDIAILATVLAQEQPKLADTAHIFIGHGTEHAAQKCYPALQAALQSLGRADLLIGVVEGEPSAQTLLAFCQARGYRKVALLPLLLVAGEHAKQDIAGDTGSWRSIFEAAGLAVRVHLRGLGSVPGVQALYAKQLQALLEAQGDGL